MSIHDHDHNYDSVNPHMRTVCQSGYQWDTISLYCRLEHLDPANPREWLNIEGNAGNNMSEEHLQILIQETDRVRVLSYPDTLKYLSGCKSEGAMQVNVQYNRASFYPQQSTDTYKFISFKGSKGIEGVLEYRVATIEHIMFEDCINLTSIQDGIPYSIKTLHKYASGCSSLEGLVSLVGIDIRGKDLSYAFNGCVNFTGEALELEGNLDTARDISYMFNGCVNFTGETLAISEPTTDAEVQMVAMDYAFSGCAKLDFTELFPYLNFTKVVTAAYAFYKTNLIPPSTIPSARYTLNGFDNLINGEYMFAQSGISFDTTQTFPKVTRVEGMFNRIGMGIMRSPLQLGVGITSIKEMFSQFSGYFKFSDTTDFSLVEDAERAFHSLVVPENSIPDQSTPLDMGVLTYEEIWGERISINLPEMPSLRNARYMFSASTINQHFETQFMRSKIEYIDGFRALPYLSENSRGLREVWDSQIININPRAKIKTAEGMVRGLHWNGGGNIAQWNMTEAENIFQMIGVGLSTQLEIYEFPVDLSGWCVPYLTPQFILAPTEHDPHWGEKCCC